MAFLDSPVQHSLAHMVKLIDQVPVLDDLHVKQRVIILELYVRIVILARLHEEVRLIKCFNKRFLNLLDVVLLDPVEQLLYPLVLEWFKRDYLEDMAFHLVDLHVIYELNPI